MKAGLKILIIVVAIVLMLFIASEIAMPIAGSWYIKREVRKRYHDVGNLSVSVRAFPALRLAFKQYGSLTVRVEGITLKGVQFESIVLKSSKFPDATYEALISQDEINRFFSPGSLYLGGAQMSLGQDSMKVSGTVDSPIGVVDATATGKLVAMNGTEVYFRPQAIDAAGVTLPAQLVSEIKDAIGGSPMFTVREDLPFTISNIAVEQGRLRVTGDVDLEKGLDIHLK